MKNSILILLWCIPGFLFSATSKPDTEKLTETADTYYQAGKVDSALWAIEQALQLAMTEKDTCAIVSCHTSQGVCLRSSGKLTEAIAAYDKALQYAPLLSGNNEENLQAITTLYNNLATLYLDMNLVYKELSDFTQAYRTLELAKALSDSLFVHEKSRQLEELSVKYEPHKKELEYQKLQEKRQKEKQNLQLKITFLLILMAIMAFVSLYFIQKQKLRIERQKREAEAQKREFETLQRDTERNATRTYLKELEKERNRLAKELHDGVCNDLYALEMNASTLNGLWKELWQ